MTRVFGRDSDFFDRQFAEDDDERAERLSCSPHNWETGADGFGVVYGVSRCRRCGIVAKAPKP